MRPPRILCGESIEHAWSYYSALSKSRLAHPSLPSPALELRRAFFEERGYAFFAVRGKRDAGDGLALML
jgi:hypothetical protein